MKKIIVILLSIAVICTMAWKFNFFNETKAFILNKFSYVVKKINYKKRLNSTKTYLLSVIDDYEKKINSYEELIVSYEMLEKENNELRNQLNIPKNSYTIIYADIIEKSYMYDYLVINKGKKENIKIGNAVITSGSFVGIVNEVGDNYSRVKLITNMKYPVMISSSNCYGQIDYYKDGYYYISGISGDVKIGDHVVTGKFSMDIPSGLLIGDVEEISYDDFELAKILKVKSYDFYDIVGVIIK